MKTIITLLLCACVSFQAVGATLKATTGELSLRDLARELGFPLLLKLNIQNITPHKNILVTLVLSAKQPDGTYKVTQEHAMNYSPNDTVVPLVASYHDNTLKITIGGSIYTFGSAIFPKLKQSFVSANDANLTSEGYLLMDAVSTKEQQFRFTLKIFQGSFLD